MNPLRSRKNSLRYRFIVGLGAMMLPLVALGVGAVVSLENVIGTFEKTEDETLEELFPLTDLESLIQRAAAPVDNYFNQGKTAERERFLQLSREVDRAYATLLADSSDLPEKQGLIETSQKAWQEAEKSSLDIFTSPDPSNDSKAIESKKIVDDRVQSAIISLDRLYKLLSHLETADRLSQARQLRESLRLAIIVAFGLGVGVAALAAVMLSRSILRPLRLLEDGVEHWGEGDLSHRIELTTADEIEQLAIAFNSMAQKLEQSQTDLRNLAILDGLTGVYNRREFNLQLRAELERSERYQHPCSLIMMDIDYFKKLNDTHGHQAGDEALRVVATLLKQEVRPTDRVARYGGEEFAVILPETTGEQALGVAQRLRETIAIASIPISEGMIIKVTVSMGVATFPTDATSEEALLSLADRSLYSAKKSGRNRVVKSLTPSPN
ncbi:MAG: diguanylate cyclase [Cyanosarcina radialis HA8281-LM2]|jgi:diguanylate cyclase (GGDEF)-like protein|nr:diguanylate cyclase [Cyanosarcina radialis HA8281-LM2]